MPTSPPRVEIPEEAEREIQERWPSPPNGWPSSPALWNAARYGFRLALQYHARRVEAVEEVAKAAQMFGGQGHRRWCPLHGDAHRRRCECECGLRELQDALAARQEPPEGSTERGDTSQEPHPAHCLCDDCVTEENMDERLIRAAAESTAGRGLCSECGYAAVHDDGGCMVCHLRECCDSSATAHANQEREERRGPFRVTHGHDGAHSMLWIEGHGFEEGFYWNLGSVPDALALQIRDALNASQPPVQEEKP